jgi:hypothetical protein
MCMCDHGCRQVLVLALSYVYSGPYNEGFSKIAANFTPHNPVHYPTDDLLYSKVLSKPGTSPNPDTSRILEAEPMPHPGPRLSAILAIAKRPRGT